MARTKTIATLCALLVVGVATVSGCSSSPQIDAQNDIPAISRDGYGGVAARLDFSSGTAQLPLDTYSLQVPAVQSKVLHALAVDADSCMVEQGYPAVADSVSWDPYTPDDNRRYGLWSADFSAKFGFDRPQSTGMQRYVIDTLPYGVDYNDAYQKCRDSVSPTMQEALTFLQAPNVDWRLRARSEELALSSSEGSAATRDWKDCMEAKGIVLDPETGYPSQLYVNQGKESEIAAAVTQADCAKTTGAIQTLFNIQAQYETAYIDANAAQLSEFAQKRTEVLSKLDTVIDGK